MIEQSICIALEQAGKYACGAKLMGMQIGPLLMLLYIPFILFALLFLANVHFKRDAMQSILLILGIPFLISLILLLAYPYLINLI